MKSFDSAYNGAVAIELNDGQFRDILLIPYQCRYIINVSMDWTLCINGFQLSGTLFNVQ